MLKMRHGLKMQDAPELLIGLGDKAAGFFQELAGIMFGIDRWREAGRERQQAGTERLISIEEDAKATRYEGEARVNEQRQRTHQDPDKRSSQRIEVTASSAVAEKVKGTAKRAAGAAVGDEQLRAEGEAQQDKAEAQGQAVKHEVKAEVQREKADAEREDAGRHTG
jgi:uncharacterized protein YjbJ (UPF0337 family)